MTDLLSLLRRERLLAILRYPGGGDLHGALDALEAGGVHLAEITVDTPGALEAIAAAAGAGRTVGYGTVLAAGQVDDAAAAGARFVVSPALVPEVVQAAREAGLEPIVGVYTATEIVAAHAAGARLLKLFPSSAHYELVAALRAPFPDAALIPTGGVGLDDIAPFLRAGATAVALGSDLAGRTAPAGEAERAALTARAARAAAVVAEYGNGLPSPRAAVAEAEGPGR